FLAPANLRNVAMQAMPMAIIGAGLTIVLITGGIDISVGAAAFVGVAVAVQLILNDVLPIPLALLVAIGIGTLVGSLNALAITRLGVNPLITTLAMMFVLRGIGQYIINNSSLMVHNDQIYDFGAGYVGPIPTAIIWGALVLIVGQIILAKTTFGRHAMAVGSNERGAIASGVNVRRTKFIAYTLCGTTAAIGGVMWFSRSATVDPATGLGAEFVAVTVVVLGGTSLAGGEGSIIPGTLFGALMLAMLENGLIVSGADPYWFSIARAAVMFVAVFADAIRIRRRAARGRRIRTTDERGGAPALTPA
ncbi:MAG: ABC transporter permease, partial [Chloroflexota bacterium]|nr:ABC transporter permease [Chloroflexota bacterium]